MYSKLAKPGGQIGIVVPGFAREHEGVPDNLREHWESDMFTIHSKSWWQSLWKKTGLVDITACYDIPDTQGIWRPWADWAANRPGGTTDIRLLDADTNDDLAFVVMTAIKRGANK